MNSILVTSQLDRTRPCAGVAKTLNGKKRQELALRVLRQTRNRFRSISLKSSESKISLPPGRKGKTSHQ